MRLTELLALFPERLRAAARRPDLIYLKRHGCAVHNRPFGTPAPGAILVLNDGRIAVYPGDPPSAELERPESRVTALYAQPPSGAPVVPTGLVFVRFRQGVSVENRREPIAQAGYEIAEGLSYAPEAAWLRASSGFAADALEKISELENLPEMENVEPQMLIARFERT